MSLALSIRCALSRFSLAIAILVLITLAATSPVAAQSPKPFKGSVVAVWDNVFKALPPAADGNPPATFLGISQVTHLGRSAQAGTLTLQFPIAPGVFPGSGSVTITGADGDELTFNYDGLLYAATGVGEGTFQFTGGTGRFLQATGTGTFYAVIDVSKPDNQPMTVVLDGTIDY